MSDTGNQSSEHELPSDHELEKESVSQTVDDQVAQDEEQDEQEEQEQADEGEYKDQDEDDDDEDCLLYTSRCV